MEGTQQVLKLGGITRSSFVYSLIAYLAILSACTWLIPKGYGPAEVLPGALTAKPYILRIEKFLYSDDNPEIVLLGSSLVLKPSLECDRAFEGLVLPENLVEARRIKQKYTKSAHLQRMLQTQVEGKFDLINLGVPSCMVGDYYLTLKKLKDFGKRPQLIVLGLAPREFLDNSYPDPKQTASYELMSQLSPVHDWARHPLSAVDYVVQLLPPFALLNEIGDSVKVKAFSFRYAIEQKGSEPVHALVATCRQMLLNSLPRQMQNQVRQTHEKPYRYMDMAAYNWSYNPPNLHHMRRQIRFLDLFVELASKWNLPVVLVDMPITAENQALIEPETLSFYKTVLREIAEKYKVTLVDANNLSGCTSADFLDSVHLNASGGHKCFNCLVNAISTNSLLRAKLCSLKKPSEM